MQTILYRCCNLPVIEEDLLEQAVRGKIRIKWLVGDRDMGFSLRLTPSELEAYERAKKKHFVVCGWKRKERAGGLIGAYFYWCEARREPYVGVQRRKVYADVTLDMISTDRRLEEWAIKAMEQAFRKFSLPRARLYRGMCYNHSDRVRIEDAEHLAAILYTIATA